MQNSSEVLSDTSDNAFIEAHYYDGGLRHRAIATSTERPKWAPAAEFVGFRDEIKLQHDDLAVEIVKFKSKANSVAWLGVYGLAPDAKYGNRNNHAGVGLWLRDLFPHDGEVLIDGLCSLLTKLRDASFDEFAETSKKFLIGFLGKIVSPYTQLAEPLAGMIPATSQTYATIGLNIPRGDTYHNRINSAVYRAFFLNPSQEETSRLLLHIHAEKGAFGTDASDDFSADVVKVLPVAFSQQAAMLDNMKAAFSKLEAERDELDAAVDKLQTESGDLFEKLTINTREHEEYRRAVEENDDLKRFTRLNDGLIQISRSIEELERSLPVMQRNLVREFHNIVTSVRPQIDLSYGNPVRSTINRPESLPSNQALNWPFIILALFNFIAFIGVGGYFLYRQLFP